MFLLMNIWSSTFPEAERTNKYRFLLFCLLNSKQIGRLFQKVTFLETLCLQGGGGGRCGWWLLWVVVIVSLLRQVEHC